MTVPILGGRILINQALTVMKSSSWQTIVTDELDDAVPNHCTIVTDELGHTIPDYSKPVYLSVTIICGYNI